ncbi:MFS transporter [Georgenia yuyongxinii]|uniref:MFS transporter n=1 Tax=Georgenia yuyongxinii TaxID=2589797 RepID=UPI00143DDC99|nr:MFS transporter [Georgenia yuyongxinii]
MSVTGLAPVFLVGALSVFVRPDLGLTTAGLGILVSLYWAASAVAAMPVGARLRRVDSRRALALAAGLAALALALMAVAPTAWVFGLGMVLSGAAGAVGQLAAAQFLADAIEPDRQGLAFGVKQAATPAAMLLAGAAVPVAAVIVGWRYTYLAVALGAAAVSVSVSVVARRRRAGKSDRSSSQVRARGFRRAPLVALSIAAACGAAVATGMAAFLVELVVARTADTMLAGGLVVVGALASIVLRIAGGGFLDRRPGAAMPLTAGLMVVGGLALFGLSVASTPAVLVVLVVLAYGAGWGWPGLLIVTVVRRHPGAPAKSSSYLQAGSWVGGVVGPMTMGVLIGQLGHTPAWIAGAVVLMGAGIGVLVSARMNKAHWVTY